MVYTYATQNMTANMAKAVRISMPISTKIGIEIASRIKGKSPQDAIKMLEAIVAMRAPLPLSRFNWNVGHKPGHMGPGRYPVDAATAVIALINSVVANAVHQSLDENKLVIHSVVVHKGAKTYKYSRVRGLKSKNTHMEIVVAQVEPTQKKARVYKNTKNENVKPAATAKPAAAQKPAASAKPKTN